MLQQKRADCAIAAMRGHDERARAVGQCLVRVGSRVQQEARRLDITRSRRKQQRRAPTPEDRVVQLFAAGALRLFAGDNLGIRTRPGAEVRSGFEQDFDDLRTPLSDCPHQRVLAVLRLCCVHIGAMDQERLHR